MYQNAIELDGISKRFAGHTAVRKLSRLPVGEK